MRPIAVSTAVSQDSLEIPLIDFSHFLDGDQPSRKSTARAILAGFQRAGFIYLRHHGIPDEEVENTFSESAKFFSRSLEEKESLAWTTPEANRGYSRPGREKVTNAESAEDIDKVRESEGADLKESLEIGKEGEPGFPNRWPDDEAGQKFRQQMVKFFNLCKDLHMNIMRAIAVGLGIDEDWFDTYCDAGDNTLRLLHYPEVKSEVFERTKTVRAGAHTDYGSVTLLFQDMAGGLQVQSPEGTFVDATPIEGTIVVNAGDLLARWSNDVIKSTKHRVVQPPRRTEVHPARYSIPYFCHPNHDSVIDAIPGTYNVNNPRKYQPVNCGEHLVQRLRATY